MKHLSAWLPLILIVSVLILSVTKGVTTESPSKPNQGQTTNSKANADGYIHQSSITERVQPTSTPASQGRASYTYNQYQQSSPWGNFPTWLQAISAIGLLVFAGWQASFIRRSTHATEQAAKAAQEAVETTERYVELTKAMTEATKQNAKVAELAYNYERPYLLIEKIEIKGIDSPQDKEGKQRAQSAASVLFGENPRHQQQFRAEVRMRNFGRGPAIIVRACCRLALMSATPSAGDFTECQEKDLFVEAIPPNEPLTFTIWGDPGYLSLNGFKAIGNQSRIAVAYGRIDYEDILRGPQYTEFCSVFHPWSMRPFAYLVAVGLGLARARLDH